MVSVAASFDERPAIYALFGHSHIRQPSPKGFYFSTYFALERN